jgi:hypothetical protein
MSNIEVPEIATLSAIAYDLPWQTLMLPIRVGPKYRQGSFRARYNEGVQVAAYLARRHTTYSVAAIGSVLGNRDGTAISHSYRRITEWRQVDKKLNTRIHEIEDVIDQIHETRIDFHDQSDPCEDLVARAYREGVSRLATVSAQRSGAMTNLCWMTPSENADSPRIESIHTVKNKAERLTLRNLNKNEERWVFEIDTACLFTQIGPHSFEPSHWQEITNPLAEIPALAHEASQ